MGKIKQGILGGFSGKVGSVVGSSWKGIAVMRAEALSYNDQKTAKQIEMRTSMGFMARVGSVWLNPAVKACYDRWAKRQSGYNVWLAKNKRIFDEQGLQGWLGEMEISNGDLLLSPIVTEPKVSGGQITITYPTTLVGRYDQATDIVRAVAIRIDNMLEPTLEDVQAEIPEGVATRADGSITLTFADSDTAQAYAIALYVVSADGTHVSKSIPAIPAVVQE